MTRRTLTRLAIVGLVLWIGGALAQEILLDENVKAGKLLCFRSYADPTKYYYLADQPHVALRDNGKPQFAFIKYAKNVAREGEGGITESQGGGVVTALMSYEVSDEDKRDAEQALAQLVPGAKLVGPVIYRAGTYAVTTPLEGGADEGTDAIKFVNNIFSTGKAPLLEGHKCAVSMNLTKEGATLLWESFKMPTSQVSVVFEMEIKGYRNPFEATITADWSQISKSHQLQAGIKAAWFGADVDLLFQDLVKNGAIKIEQKGEDANMEKIIAEAQRLLLQQMFDRADMPNMSTLAQGAGGNQSYSNLDRAVGFMRDEETSRRSRPSGSREGSSRGSGSSSSAPVEWPVETSPFPPESGYVVTIAGEPTSSTESGGGAETTTSSGTETGEGTETAGGTETGGGSRDGLRTSPLLGGGDSGGTTSRRESLRRPGDRSPAAERRDALASPYGASGSGGGTGTGGTGTGGRAGGRTAEGGRGQQRNSSGVAMLVSYKMRQIRVSGTTVINLKKYTLDTQAFPFTENIGGLNRYMKDEGIFKAINLDDPVFQQREVLVALDGQDADDFTKFINYVTVQIRKKHGNGELTYDELKINKTNFNQSANNFRMVYGWKGDKDRAQWIKFDYRVRWSFFGGAEYEEPWRTTDDYMISVSPPTRYRTIRFEADPGELADLNVRHVEATMYYTLFGKPFTEQVTLQARDEAPEKEIEYVCLADDFNYEYELAWRLRGNKRIESGRQKTNETIIYCDELPETTEKPSN